MTIRDVASAARSGPACTQSLARKPHGPSRERGRQRQKFCSCGQRGSFSAKSGNFRSFVFAARRRRLSSGSTQTRSSRPTTRPRTQARREGSRRASRLPRRGSSTRSRCRAKWSKPDGPAAGRSQRGDLGIPTSLVQAALGAHDAQFRSRRRDSDRIGRHRGVESDLGGPEILALALPGARTGLVSSVPGPGLPSSRRLDTQKPALGLGRGLFLQPTQGAGAALLRPQRSPGPASRRHCDGKPVLNPRLDFPYESTRHGRRRRLPPVLASRYDPRHDRRQNGVELFEAAVGDGERPAPHAGQVAAEGHDACRNRTAAAAGSDPEQAHDGVRAAGVAAARADHRLQVGARRRSPPDPVRRRGLRHRGDASARLPD
jgi:hypothetical protein